MVIGVKDSFKLIGVVIITFCAVFVCTLFLNYSMDMTSIETQVSDGAARILYDAQMMSAKVVCGVSGGCLLITSVVLLCFYIKHYIDTHGKELGILKALGYSNLQIAKGFAVFGLSVLIGTAAGFGGAFCIMQLFYETQNTNKFLPDIIVHFHPVLIFSLVLLPTFFFSVLAVLYSCIKLKMPVQTLLRGKADETKKQKKTNTDLPFLQELRKNTVRQRSSLIFFIAFATFCYSAMLQMSISMNELSSVMMGMMIMLIGIVLACATLFLAITTVVNANTKTIAMMRVFGYPHHECYKAILGGYRPIAWCGFAVGTVYQFGLLKIMVSVVFKDVEGIPEYGFDTQAFIIALVSFIVIYELIMYCYSQRMKQISIKQIMLE